MVQTKHTLTVICEIILIIGALNWGLVGAFDFNLVAYIFSPYPLVEKAVYDGVGIAGLYILYRIIIRMVRA
ncbi:DUF378 domain-containing protein [Candidatus Odyssella acanthamoebae]|uniref:DUF378 domain-containing protein n=1 Tax=Candidatus Odyssella acanthamoebae TaxID=91604 RepID=A0A077AZ77_9PROT|nr:DUF378 domain-containing protein [Candidatus Paracaedibacter acanthamoebae]AIK97309.1 hypothetical protein ID47_12055 [Candidatus Paracaedibacter acanthamoebae]